MISDYPKWLRLIIGDKCAVKLYTRVGGAPDEMELGFNGMCLAPSTYIRT